MTSPRVTVQQAWDALAEGNERFMAGDLHHPQQNAARRSELRASQAPNAAFLGCSDSRVAAEILFDCGLGDLAWCATSEIAKRTPSRPWVRCRRAGCRRDRVLAHGTCGAVKCDRPDHLGPERGHPGDPQDSEIRPAVQQEWFATQQVSPYVDPSLIDVDAVGRRHLDETVNALMRQSTVISDAVAAGELGIVGCQYQLEEGRVSPISWVGQLEITR